MKNVKFRAIPRQKDEFCGKFRGSNSAEKPKFRGSARNSAGHGKLGPIDDIQARMSGKTHQVWTSSVYSWTSSVYRAPYQKYRLTGGAELTYMMIKACSRDAVDTTSIEGHF